MRLAKPIGYCGLCAALLVAGVAAWRGHLASELHSRVYRVGFGDDPPFQFRAAGGTPTGVAIEIVREAARRRGIHLEWTQPEHFSASAIQHGEVDLWVLMTDLPERRRSMYISDPYLTMERCFLVLKSTGIRSARDLERARIAYRQTWVTEPPGSAPRPQGTGGAASNAVSSNADELYLRAHFPAAGAVPLPIERAGGLDRALQDHTADAVLVNKTVVATRLISEGGRETLDLINAPDAIAPLSLGASLDARRAAQAIRDEIDRMAEDGGMSRITEPWGFFQSASLNVVGQLRDAKRTNQMLAEGMVGLAAATLLIGLLSILVRRERNAVRDLGSRLISAQEQERKRIARDLHDDINQQLAVIAMSVSHMKRSEAASGRLGPERWQHLLSQVEQVRGGVHRISHALHPTLLELSGLLLALDALRRAVAVASGKVVSLDPGPLAPPGAVAVPPEIALCLYRVTQEALQNAVKHSVSNEVRIRVGRTGKTLELSVSDSGKGFSVVEIEAGAGLGLVSMRERARLLHGQLRIESYTKGPRQGTTVTISLPLGQVLYGETEAAGGPTARVAVADSESL